MKFTIHYSDLAQDQLKNLRAFDRVFILDRIDSILTATPEKESKTTIKLLRQPALSQYRLRVGNFRIFYKVEESTVRIAQILTKQQVNVLGSQT